MRLERTAAERIEHFSKHDKPVANILRLIVNDIKAGAVGTPYDQLDLNDVNESRIHQTFSELPVSDCNFHWKELPGPGMLRRVLVVVITVENQTIILNVGYIPRQQAKLY